MYDSEDSELLQSKIKEKVSHHSSSNTNMQARGSLDRSGSKASKTGSNLQNSQQQQYPTMNLQSLLNSARQGQKRLTREELQQQQTDHTLNKVYFGEFLRTLQEFQLRQHELYLKVLTKLFRKVDLDNDGIIEESEFLKLLNSEIGPFLILDGSEQLAFTDEEVTYFLQVLDPFNTQKISFSEVVQLFSSHQVKHVVHSSPHKTSSHS